MQGERKDFIHVLLFECSSCHLPVMHALTSGSKNVEEIDLDHHKVVCICGWTGEVLGLDAKRHWVEPWNETPVRDRRPD